MGLPLSFKVQCLSQIKRGLCLAGCHVVAHTQGYHLVFLQGSLVKFQGCGVVVCLVLECRFSKFLFLGLPLTFKALCLPQIKEERIIIIIIIIIITLLISSKRLFSLIYNVEYLKLSFPKISLKNAVLF